MDRKVWLPSGGTLVIDRTEAMTVVDVNTGKFTGSGGNLEQTVTRNNLEAAEEIVRQLRLRDIGGIVVIDFIDMVLESNRDLVLRRLTEALARDRTRHQVSEVTSLGLVQLTRKRLGTGLIEAFSSTCTHCGGRGIVLHSDPIDTASGAGRKAESNGGGGGRRGKRGKRGAREQEVQVAKVPAHSPGEHPMFKAMAAANGKHEDDEDHDEDEATGTADEVAELDPDAIRTAVTDAEDEELDDEFDDSDDEDSDDEDDEDSDDEDDDIEVLDSDDDDSDDDDSDDDDDFDDDSDDEDDLDDDSDDDSDDSDEDSDDEDEDQQPAAVTARPVRQRRRAAARPAGPPSHE